MTFTQSPGHGKQLDFVRDYWQQFQAKQTNLNPATTAGH
jgi:hypothetical protein